MWECRWKQILKEKTIIPSTEKVEYTSEHELVSISVCSNVPGYLEPKCFVLDTENGHKILVRNMIEYMLEISDTSAMLMRELYTEFMADVAETTLSDKFESH